MSAKRALILDVATDDETDAARAEIDRNGDARGAGLSDAVAGRLIG